MFQAGTTNKHPNVMHKGHPSTTNGTDYAKYYKIILRSKDADYFTYNNNNGTPNIHRFNNVTFPEGIEGNAVLVMESFVAENPNGELDTGYTVSIPEIMQPRTWGSDRNGSTDIVLTGRGAVWQNGSVEMASCGIPVTNSTFFRNARLTVEIKSIKNIDTAFTAIGDWVLTFYIIVYGGENVLKP